MTERAAGLVGLALLLLGPGLAPPAPAAEPWRLEDAVGLPEALSLRLQHRTRFESLDDQFRASRKGNDQILVFRTSLHARYQPLPWLTFGAELLDSRSQLDDRGTPMATSIVNATELLQVYAEVSGEWLPGGPTTVRGGRLTLDVGSRRFVARNRFRNTINAFTGIDATTALAERHALRAFFLLPIQRRPTDVERLRDNDIVFDRESTDVRFWGLFYEGAAPCETRVEAFLFGLNEDDSPGRPTRDRDLYTPGFRLLRAPAPGALDFQLESAVQLGKQRASTTATGNLDHFAHFHHAEVGYTAEVPGSPRFVLQYDYASGDENPNDGDSGRFDTLFGARRFDFGPTGIYGPFVRANLTTPGARVIVKPCPTLETFVAYRGYWLAEGKDAAGATGLRDPSGDAGRFLGSQVELRIRWDAIPGNVRLETGYAHLFSGDFLDDAPGRNGQGDADYVYGQVSLGF